MDSSSRAAKQSDPEAGVLCADCGREIFRVQRFQGREYCLRCYYKLDEIWLEMSPCLKCGREAALFYHLSEGLLQVKRICPECGVHEERGAINSPPSPD